MKTSERRFDLNGRVVVITGGGGILGRRLTAALADHGGLVAVLDRDATKAEEAVANSGYPDRVRAYVTDVTDRPDIERTLGQIEQDLGSPAVLVNNAAAKSPNFFSPFEQFPLEDWCAVLDSNLTSAMLCCQVFGGAMVRRAAGSVINVLSVYGVVAPDQRIYVGSLYEGHPINSPAVYSASKAGLWGLTQYLAAYWGAAGVRVNAITPGGVFSGQNDQFVKNYSARVPLGRMAGDDEISGAVLFLASDASSYVTGHNLVIDGGLTVW
jgi:NAD(P)-dependent dehydrogenase (short-subunit alcohol dehydrogenase family)